MSADHCSFCEPILNGGFGCSRGEPVVRRAGPDIACRSPVASARCEQVLARMKSVGLPIFDCEDDLLTMPHSVLMKIKSGGLLGLQYLLTSCDARTVGDIHSCLDSATDRYLEITNIPFEKCTDSMKQFSVRRRTRREP